MGLFGVLRVCWSPNKHMKKLFARVFAAARSRREAGALHCLFSTPANANPPPESQRAGCLLWLTATLTRRELAAVWTGRASVCLASRWISNGFVFPFPTVRFQRFDCRTTEVGCLLVERSGVYENRKRNQMHIPTGIKSSWVLGENWILQEDSKDLPCVFIPIKIISLTAGFTILQDAKNLQYERRSVSDKCCPPLLAWS